MTDRSENKGIIASIITYNPDLKKLKLNLEKVIGQVDKVLIIDNSSLNCLDIDALIKQYYNVIIIKHEKNMGISISLNEALKYGFDENYKWLLTLDQDSTCDERLVNKYLEVMNSTNNQSIGIYTCQVLKNGEEAKKYHDSIDLIDRCITSGSLMNIDATKVIGGYDSSLFIDWVDNDICKSMLINGYEILRVNSAYIYHELGPQSTVKLSKLMNRLFNCREIRTPYPPLRVYYYIRNGVYYREKYRKQLDKEELKRTNYEIRMAIIRNVILGRPKLKYIQSILKGYYDGHQLSFDREYRRCKN